MTKTIQLFLVIFLISISVKLSAQTVTSSNVEKFFKSTTCVVLDDNIFNVYNAAIKDAVKLNWTITPFEVISMSEFTKRRANPKFSFLVRTKVTFPGDAKKARDTPYSFLSLVLGRKGAVTAMPDLAQFPLSYYDVDYDKYLYKLPAILLFIQEHMNWLKANPGVKNKTVASHYRTAKISTKDKTLYLIEDELSKDINTENEIRKNYPCKVQIVSPEKIKEAIDTKNDNIVFLHKVGPAGDYAKMRCYKLILGAANGKLYYFSFHKIKEPKKPDAFLKSDLVKLGKQ